MSDERTPIYDSVEADTQAANTVVVEDPDAEPTPDEAADEPDTAESGE